MTLDARDRVMKSLTTGQRMATARAVAVEKMPYFRAGIVSMVPRAVPGLGTFGITDASILMFDPATLAGFTPNEAAAVLVHEYMHIFMRHSARFKKLLAVGVLAASKADRDLFNAAADAEINDNLIAAGFKLPVLKTSKGEEMQPITPAGLGLPDHKTAEEYVVLLKQQRQRKGKEPGQGHPGPAQDDPGSDPPSPPEPDSGQDSGGWGQCGSGAGNPLPDEPPTTDPDGRSEVDQNVDRRSQVEQIAQRSKSRGDVPLGIAQFAELETAPSVIPWQQKLSSALREAAAFVHGSIDYTRNHRSRVQGGLEMRLGVFGAPIMEAMHAPLAEVAFVADTSGSMGETEQAVILSEAEGILKALAGTRVTFVACDAKVHTMARVGSVAEMKKGMLGGGGTDFRPAFQALEKMRPRPNVLVFATDGYGRYPEGPPSGIRVIWLNVNGEISVDWGEVIVAEPSEGA